MPTAGRCGYRVGFERSQLDKASEAVTHHRGHQRADVLVLVGGRIEPPGMTPGPFLLPVGFGLSVMQPRVR